MKIEAGKYYRTRDGRKVFVAYIDDGSQGWDYPVLGVLETQDPENQHLLDLDCYLWRRSGQFDNDNSPEDLIAPWDDEWDYQPKNGDRCRGRVPDGEVLTFTFVGISDETFESLLKCYQNAGIRFAKPVV